MDSLHTVVIAAGRSSRMGRDKGLVPMEGEAALVRILRICSAAGFGGTVVVGPHNEGDLAPLLPDRTWTLAVNPDPRAGRTGSIACGLPPPTSGIPGILLFPVDHPYVRSGTLVSLRDRFVALPAGARDRAVLVPRHDGRNGHPILFGRGWIPPIRSAPPGRALREILEGNGDRIEVPVDDPGVLRNADRPEDHAG